jgi:agmatine deiminase
LAWPSCSGDADQDEAARDDCLELATLLSERAPVTLLANPEDVAEASLRTPSGVAAMPVVHDSTRLRAAAPLFLVDGEGKLAAGLDFGAPAGRAVLDAVGVPTLEAPPGMGGGVVEVDGQGTALVSRAMAGRTGLAADMLEQLLAAWCGVERTLWLEGSGEVSSLARFLAPGVVAASGEAAACLKGALDALGRELTVVELPAPKRSRSDGQRLSYVDCALAGDLILVPAYGEGRDDEALGRIAAALPGRKVMPVPSMELAVREGGIGAMVAVQPG